MGGGFPVSVQTMWKEPLRQETLQHVVRQLDELSRAGCDLVRFAVPDLQSADIVGSLARATGMPVVADIHFDYRIAMRCLDHPVAKVRINPGTIGEESRVRDVVCKAMDRGVSLRIGINAGSLPRSLEGMEDKAVAMVRAAEEEIEVLERLGCRDAVFSLKSSDVEQTVKANIVFANTYDYPLHIGVTEAGPLVPGIVRNTIGISTLLSQGIGDTIRVSLSAPALQEVAAGVEILRQLRQRTGGVTVISCPQCGRASFDVQTFLEQVSSSIQGQKKSITVAVMGCPVNGPGEARAADLGITGAGGKAIIFSKGEIVHRVSFELAIQTFREELEKVCASG
jgi:(E)-4-hydroxy-3-methylbut-2-enyl-diphosphate synthase